jgi:putative ABC transport system permease protein
VRFKLVWENVRFRPVRTFLSILLIAIPVTLILMLIGLSHGMLEDSARRAQGVGADIVFRAPSSSVISFNGGTLPASLIAFLGRQPHVVGATGVLNQPVEGGIDTVAGIDPPAFERMSGGFVFTGGHTFQRPTDILLDQYYAAQRHVRAGGTINILHRDWNVAGIVEPGKLSHLFLELPVLQDMVGATGKVSQIYLKLDSPDNTEAVIDDLKAKFNGYPIYSMKELMSLISVNNIPVLRTFIDVIVGIGVVIGFAVVSLSMSMAVLQRTREIGILKSLGASKGFVMGLILCEAFALGLGGTIVGILFSFGTKWIMGVFVPASLPQAIVPSWWPIAGLVAMGAALLGALYPGAIAVRQDPIEALAYE